jgi:hypothetical protein
MKVQEIIETSAVVWHPGDMAEHRLAKGLVLKIEEVPGNGIVKAKVVNKGETNLWEGNVTTFRTEYLIPV